MVITANRVYNFKADSLDIMHMWIGGELEVGRYGGMKEKEEVCVCIVKTREVVYCEDERFCIVKMKAVGIVRMKNYVY